MKKILLPTDFSDNSLNAIHYAIEFFKNWTCSFYILNVQKSSEYIMDDIMLASSKDTISDCIVTDNKQSLKKVIRDLKHKKDNSNHEFHALFDFDNITSAINQAIAFHDIDLIIMGTNGSTGAKEVLFGSNTLKVIRNVKCPLLIIPEKYTFSGIKNVVLATQTKDTFNFEDFETFKALLNMHQSTLHIIHFAGEKRNSPEQMDLLKTLFKDFPHTLHIMKQSSHWRSINVASQLLESDLNAFVVEKESFLTRFLSGSATSEIANGTEVPLFIIHE